MKKEKDREQELAREQEVYKNMQLLKGGRSSAGNKEKATVQTAQAQMNFMYVSSPSPLSIIFLLYCFVYLFYAGMPHHLDGNHQRLRQRRRRTSHSHSPNKMLRSSLI